MSLLYADPSALARAYLADEPDHDDLRRLLLDRTAAVVTSEIARIELASAVKSALRAGRIRNTDRLHDRIDDDTGEGGAIFLAELRPRAIMPYAHKLVRTYRLRTLDAIHLAVALEDAPSFAGSAEVVLVTRDAYQAAAARALGLSVR
ncbi:MAG: PIN domain-containing protein [Gaiellaceae bacterium MAG52_C11]|nr:PIN domain-containing protein [Candidatus Gaiellasilicea maunaloa]